MQEYSCRFKSMSSIAAIASPSKTSAMPSKIASESSGMAAAACSLSDSNSESRLATSELRVSKSFSATFTTFCLSSKRSEISEAMPAIQS